jgi:hypothetical protein
VNKEALEELRFGLDLIHLALNLDGNDSAAASGMPGMEQLEGTLRAIGTQARRE